MDLNRDNSSSCISLLQTDLFPNARTIKTRFSKVCSTQQLPLYNIWLGRKPHQRSWSCFYRLQLRVLRLFEYQALLIHISNYKINHTSHEEASIKFVYQVNPIKIQSVLGTAHCIDMFFSSMTLTIYYCFKAYFTMGLLALISMCSGCNPVFLRQDE